MNLLDLFAGAGGLSEGFIRSGFEPVAHVEKDKYASQTLETRTAYYYLIRNGMLNDYQKYQKTYNEDDKTRQLKREELLKNVPKELLDTVINIGISEETIDEIFDRIDQQLKRTNRDDIDLIIGGPPCQAYSVIGRSRDAKGKLEDPRNYLYQMYVRFLEKYKPKAFVFENVPGIYTAHKGNIYKDLEYYLKHAGYIIKTYDLNAFDFGVPQNRKRVIIIGWREDLGLHEFNNVFQIDRKYCVNDMLNDLPSLKAGESYKKYSYKKRNSKLLKDLKLRKNAEVLTHHIARTHNDRDLEIYKLAVDMWNKEQRRIKYTDLPDRLITHNNIESFLDRFKVVAGNLEYSHTIVAHISKDGHHYIHPDIEQNRSLTVREAARLQSFPDDYFFEGPRTANFVQIGNAVPPLMAEGIANWFLNELQIKTRELVLASQNQIII